jgi:pimeloyl-ACP methyl ester carboxylesterase
MITKPVKNELAKTSWLDLPQGRRLAYSLTEGKAPGVVFFSGFKSDMSGTKATSVEEFCREEGRFCLRFDYTGHGQSSGLFRNGCISDWKRDALDVIDNLTKAPNILVGSSMGAWIMLLVALARPEKIAGLVGIASAPDFTELLVWDKFTPEQKKQLKEDGGVLIPDCYGGEPYPITRKLIKDGRKHLLFGDVLDIRVPVRLIHGTEDKDVPWRMSHDLMEHIASPDISLELIKGGDHRLSQPPQLATIIHSIEELFNVR